jgi:hypothetical protein
MVDRHVTEQPVAVVDAAGAADVEREVTAAK